MKQRFRLRKSSDIKRVWRDGHSYINPLMVLVISNPPDSFIGHRVLKTRVENRNGFRAENGFPCQNIRIAVIAGSKVGNAVQRNRAKRCLRAALELFLPHLRGNHDMLILARKPVIQAPFDQILAAMTTLFSQARLLDDSEASG